MAERGKHLTAYLPAGSNTTVKSTAGSLYGIFVMPGHGSSITVVNSTDLGASPDLNSDTLTGIIGRFGNWSTTSNGVSPFPDHLPFAGVGFDALTLAATSNARLVVEYE